MECLFCGKDPKHCAGVFHPDCDEYGLACIFCAIENGVYCSKHSVPHGGFGGWEWGTLCRECCDEMEAAYSDRADAFYTAIRAQMFSDGLSRLNEWIADMRGPWKHLGGDARIVLRGIVQEALRRHPPVLPEQVVQEVCTDCSPNKILPTGYVPLVPA